MGTTLKETLTYGTSQIKAIRLSREATLRLAALGAIVILAAVLRFANLNALGYANHYYTAAVESMLKSWHNFFFVAAEPGGSVSVDKPPVGLWLQAISAYFFGVNGFAVLLPQILAGILSVIVLYHLVRRKFGTVAGLLAALALAVTPVVVATDRNNTIDSTLILTLLLATWAFIKATESRKLWLLLLGVFLVGVGFNIKMLEAFLPLPALYALYFLGSSERIWKKLAKLGLATIVLAVVSLSWAVAVDLVPEDQRPYVGSSGDNSVMSLMIGYNGVDRLLGRGFGRTGGTCGMAGGNNTNPRSDGSQNSNGTQPSGPGANNANQPPSAGSNQNNDGTRPSRPGANDGAQLPNQGGNNPRQFAGQGSQGGAPGGGGTGASQLGQAGVLRLLTPPLSKEAG